MVKEIKEIQKKDIPQLMEDATFWDHPFLAVSKHRLWSHYHNPTCADRDIVLLLAYIDGELVGYMGAYTDFVYTGEQKQKIAWLSTWWVHPKTKGTGIGRLLLDTMYTKQNGQIGISQFTPSAKRVYDKSGYFMDLKSSPGIKAVLRSNLSFIIPTLLPKAKFAHPFFAFADRALNVLINARLSFCRRTLQKKLKNNTIDYLPFPDTAVRVLIDTYGKQDIAQKNNAFFNWLKTYHWVYEAPLLANTTKDRYVFSMYDQSFGYYFVKISEHKTCIGFIVLQKRGTTLKVLFTYFDGKKYGELAANVIKQHAIQLKIREIICYDPAIVTALFSSSIFLYKKEKVKQSIISKAFGLEDFSNIRVNFGDGDCCFA